MSSPSPDLSAALQRYLGYPAFRAGQEALVGAAVGGRDALGILPTGGGKSVCFQLPAFLLSGTVLVVSPLISLMEDQMGRARRAGLAADLLNSALSPEQAREVVQRARAGRTQLLLVAPERFQVPSFRALLNTLSVSLLAVDEAHCISQWGHDFRPSYLRIGEVRRQLRAPVLALTATATPRVRDEIASSLLLRDPIRVVGSFDRPNLTWEVRSASGHREKVQALSSLLRERSGATIVYASTRRSVEAVRRALASWGLPALSYHAGLSPQRRSRVQERFLADPAPVVVATNAFGMGIDRPDVRLVVHYQLAGTLEGYYQEAGRAGRDGASARCVALHGERDRAVHDRFVAAAYPSERRLGRLLRLLRDRAVPGDPAAVSLRALARGLGKGVGEEEVVAALRALARGGALEMEDPEASGGSPPFPGDDPHRLRITLLGREADFGTLASLRRVALGQLEAVQAYAQSPDCRRRKLLGYFGENVEEAGCGRCDRCREAPRERVGSWRTWTRALLGWRGAP